MKEISDAFGYTLAGFTAGEGCFLIHKCNRPNLRASYHCRFHIELRDDDRAYLKELQHTLQMGKIYDMPARPRPSRNGQPTARLVIYAINECIQLVRFFEKYPVPTKKRGDFEIWKQAVFELQKPWDCRDVELLEYLFLKIKEVRQYDVQEALPRPIKIDLQLTIEFPDLLAHYG